MHLKPVEDSWPLLVSLACGKPQLDTGASLERLRQWVAIPALCTREADEDVRSAGQLHAKGRPISGPCQAVLPVFNVSETRETC